MKISKYQFRAIRRRLKRKIPNVFDLFGYDKQNRCVIAKIPVNFDVNDLFEKENEHRMIEHEKRMAIDFF